MNVTNLDNILPTLRLQENRKHKMGHNDYIDNLGYQSGSEEQVILPVFLYHIFLYIFFKSVLS